MVKRYLSDQNPDGTVFGTTAADPISFHDAAPSPQGAAIADPADDLATDANGTAIAAAVNGNAEILQDVIDVLRAKGLIATS